MKRIVHIVCFIFLFCCSITAQNKGQMLVLEGEVFYSQILKQDVKYSICLPDNYYSSKESYPTVYMLHGYGDNSASWLEYGIVDRYTNRAVKDGQIIPMIYIMPEGYTTYYVNDYYGKFSYQDMFIKELIPLIEKKYRTRSQKEYRATMGYSMGGFGALMLAAKNEDLFTVTVPLSISVRTDEQYQAEEALGWDDQWGNLFGGKGEKGADRLTDYYKQNSPFHAISENTKLKIFIDCGDDEYTLARSNEELHILLRNKNIPHEYRVRDGGHDFIYWQAAMINGLNFISDSFSGKIYRGDKKNALNKQSVKLSSVQIEGKAYSAYLPDDYQKGNRKYPVLYVNANLSDSEKGIFAGIANQLIDEAKIAPQIIVFSNDANIEKPIPLFESKLRIREGRRFRAYLGYKDSGARVLNSLTSDLFTCISVFDTPIQKENALFDILNKSDKKQFSRTWIYIDAPDRGSNYVGNGLLHALLRDKEIYHEYRVREGKGDVEYLYQGLEESLKYISQKYHY